MPAFSVGDEVIFQLHPRGALVRGTVKRVLDEEIHVEDEEQWTVRVWPDHPDQWIVRKADYQELTVEVPEGWT